MLNWRTLGFGLTFGIMDSVTLPIIKGVSTGWNSAWILIPVAIYAVSPFIFLKALEQETLTIMNLVWDMTSDVLVTIIGMFVFEEKLPPTKIIGVLLSFVALFLMSYEGDGWNEYLTRNFKRLTG